MTLFLADDHTLFRKGLMQILESDPSIEVVGEAGDGIVALEALREFQPDVALVDVGMPSMNGLDIASVAQREAWHTAIVILTMYNEEEYLHRALDAGVRGYLLKENAVADLKACLQAVREGRYYVSPVLTEFLVNLRSRTAKLVAEHPSLDRLTATERQVLRGVAENKTSRQIADALHISYRTVQTHRSNICKKLGFSGHNRLLHFALEHRSALRGITNLE